MTMRGVWPNTVSYTAWFGQSLAGGRLTTTHAMNDAKTIAPKPAHTTLRARA